MSSIMDNQVSNIGFIAMYGIMDDELYNGCMHLNTDIIQDCFTGTGAIIWLP